MQSTFDVDHLRTGTLTWPERIENYRQRVGIPYLGHENGWTYGTWFMGNSYVKKTDYYGGFQGNFLKRIDALFPDRQRVLHLFAGRVDLERFPGATLDLNHELKPDYCVDAETCAGVPLQMFDFVLGDPPYALIERGLSLLDAGELDALIMLFRHDHLQSECQAPPHCRIDALNRATQLFICAWRPFWLAERKSKPRWTFTWTVWERGAERRAPT